MSTLNKGFLAGLSTTIAKIKPSIFLIIVYEEDMIEKMNYENFNFSSKLWLNYF